MSTRIQMQSLQSPKIILPVLRVKPSYQDILKTLEDLEPQFPTWNGVLISTSPQLTKQISSFLLSIISSDLNWLSDGDDGADDQKDDLLDLASRRLAELCGRSAMPEMVRDWVVTSSVNHPELQFKIREPPLTGDNLGLKTWGTAYAILKKLEQFGYDYIGHVSPQRDLDRSKGPPDTPIANVLELGSGTGLLGIGAAAIWGLHVTLTDLPQIQENLLFNIQQNSPLVESLGGKMQCNILDWTHINKPCPDQPKNFEIIIAADPLYDDEHPRLVAQNVRKHLKPVESSRVLIAIPLRDKHTETMAHELDTHLQSLDFEIVKDGEETCYDDWGTRESEDSTKCWWAIWRPKPRHD